MWLILLLTIAVAVGTLFIKSVPSDYQARSVVTAVTTPIPVEEFEISVTLFYTDEVIGPVADQLGGDTTSATLLGERRLEADWVSGGGLEITGTARNQERALLLANSAAQSFASTLESKQLGTFAILLASEATLEPSPPAITFLLGGGALGASLGVAFLLVVFALRQPILTEDDALEEFPADKVFPARIHRRPFIRPWRSGSIHPRISPSGVTSAIQREIETASNRGGSACCVIVGRRKEDPGLRLILAEIGVFKRWPHTDWESGFRRPYWVGASDDVLIEALHAADTVIVLVSEGSTRGLLRVVGEELAVAQDEQARILVFVKGSRGRLRPTAKTGRDAPKPDREWRKSLQRESR